MSWQDDAMAEQDMADALFEMGEAEWRDLHGNKDEDGIDLSPELLLTLLEEEDEDGD